MLASDNSKIKEMINSQISVSYDNEDSFFCNIRDILILYDLPSITDLQAKLPLKISWKKLVRKEVDTFWLKRLQNDATANYLKIFGHKTSRNWDKLPLMEDEIKNKYCGEEIDNKS